MSPPKVLRTDNGPELVSQALQRFCENEVGPLYAARHSAEQRPHRIIRQSSAQKAPQSQPLLHPVRGQGRDRGASTRNTITDTVN
jgi:hypothetical protein